eukprot:gnl/TRDRNA2_/TRDRNA2_169033_c0_seq2.p2 gnl/TRDRNA2_/TRDRNA2_169033_c0~~gnl/TRDRNA2_/TRDRNA2_169033_c0_seq2.p2  ORF type:complete len:102 (+),score=16.30 gnl/TRDRNA2_/TRDRNA2_169033_c0_seq2:160-465(+)
MALWGIYLEDNDIVGDIASYDGHGTLKPKRNCSAGTGAGSSVTTLRGAAEAALQISSAEAQPGLTAPRCKQAILDSQDSGLIRCSFARLAWERCGAEWHKS